MVLTKSELIASLQNEVRILLHLGSKIDRGMLDYRPTPKQRSVIELMQYLTVMGPALVQAAKTGAFDAAAWTQAEQAARARDFDQTLAVISAHGTNTRRCSPIVHRSRLPRSGGDVRPERAPAVRSSSIMCSADAPPTSTQLFLYLKACGRDELNTMNLWAGMDGAA